MHKKLKKLLIRYLRAKKLGFSFIRTKNFRLPSKIRINGKYKEICLPSFPGIEELFRDIILDDEYFLESLRGKSIETIADVGANVGIFGIAASAHFPNATIHAYEPNSGNIAYLSKQSCELDFLLFEEAVSGHDGNCELLTNSKHDTSASISLSSGQISCSSLRTVVNRFKSKSLDLLKLDCEGSEFEILKDKETLEYCSYITMEYHLSEKSELRTLKKLLSEANFSIIFSEQRNNALGNILAEKKCK